jgi:hypothetical protein
MMFRAVSGINLGRTVICSHLIGAASVMRYLKSVKKNNVSTALTKYVLKYIFIELVVSLSIGTRIDLLQNMLCDMRQLHNLSRGSNSSSQRSEIFLNIRGVDGLEMEFLNVQEILGMGSSQANIAS